MPAGAVAPMMEAIARRIAGGTMDTVVAAHEAGRAAGALTVREVAVNGAIGMAGGTAGAGVPVLLLLAHPLLPPLLPPPRLLLPHCQEPLTGHSDPL